MSKKIAAEKTEIANKSPDKIVPGEKRRIVWDTRRTVSRLPFLYMRMCRYRQMTELMNNRKSE